MRRKIIILFVIFLPYLALAQGNKFSFGGGFGFATLAGGYPPRFTYSPEYRLKFEADLKERLRLDLRLSFFQIYNDTTAMTSFTVGSIQNYRTQNWAGYDLTVLLKYHRRLFFNRLDVVGGIGAGVAFWKIVDPKIDTVFKTIGERGETIDISASEITLSALIGAEYFFSERWKLSIDCGLMNLTGIGTEFSHHFDKTRDHWVIRPGLTFSYLFGGDYWPKRKPLKFEEPVRVVYENKTPVIDTAAKNYPPKTEIIPVAVPKKSDFPEVDKICLSDGSSADGLIDQYGCPIDSDCDGFPDYLDHCPHNAIGTVVDSIGCPYDRDHDGIPDGFDLCPDSDTGYAIDRTGCLDLFSLEKSIRLDARYQSGTFEVDPETGKHLIMIARILKKARGVRMDIFGYANELPTADENLALSQKRANRVRDYLVVLGIDINRLNPKGKGNTGSTVSEKNKNDIRIVTPIELVFIK
jgi:hypothetical protein